MLSPSNSNLQRLRIVLGSSSPRRQTILRENAGLSFDIVVPTFAEDVDKSTCNSPMDYVNKTCREKALDVLHQLTARGDSADLIIVADTIVATGDIILEKPSSEEDAREMIALLSGSSHSVITSVTFALRKACPFFVFSNQSATIMDRDVEVFTQDNYHVVTFCENTTVFFSTLTDAVIRAYVATGEPMDKAGGYGIQALGSSLVRRIEGCYFNVVGFPLNRFCTELSHYLIKDEKATQGL